MDKRDDMMDWITDFTARFKHCPELKDLRETKFHGSLIINFCNGLPENLDFKSHKRAVKIDGNKQQP